MRGLATTIRSSSGPLDWRYMDSRDSQPVLINGSVRHSCFMRRVRSLIGRSGHYVPTIYRRCPESDASTLTTISVAFGRGRAEGETVYQAGEVELAEAIPVQRGVVWTMGEERSAGVHISSIYCSGNTLWLCRRPHSCIDPVPRCSVHGRKSSRHYPAEVRGCQAPVKSR